MLFRSVDPTTLDMYSRRDLARSSKTSRAQAEVVMIMRRGLQQLSPRELMILFLTQGLGIEQDSLVDLFRVRQSNISYRARRAQNRLVLFRVFFTLISETEIRRRLLSKGFSGREIQTFLGIVRTTSQVAVMEALGLSQSVVRNIFQKVSYLASKGELSPDMAELVTLVETSYNALRILSGAKWQAQRTAGMPDVCSQEQP